VLGEQPEVGGVRLAAPEAVEGRQEQRGVDRAETDGHAPIIAAGADPDARRVDPQGFGRSLLRLMIL
jgi:hypothetical protein